MAQKELIARAGKGLLDFLALVLRGVGALCAASGALILIAFKSEDSSAGANGVDEDVVGQDEADHYGWDSW